MSVADNILLAEGWVLAILAPLVCILAFGWVSCELLRFFIRRKLLPQTLHNAARLYLKLKNTRLDSNPTEQMARLFILELRHAGDQHSDAFNEALWEQFRKSFGPDPRYDSGAALIAIERLRQQTKEGWTPAHDDEHDEFELSQAAESYCRVARGRDGSIHWPWDLNWWKPSENPIRNLVKAGALIAAEIDRLQRIK